jgi:hypothetical protein
MRRVAAAQAACMHGFHEGSSATLQHDVRHDMLDASSRPDAAMRQYHAGISRGQSLHGCQADYIGGGMSGEVCMYMAGQRMVQGAKEHSEMYAQHHHLVHPMPQIAAGASGSGNEGFPAKRPRHDP